MIWGNPGRVDAVMAGFTLSRQHLEHAADMAGFAIDNIVLAFQGKARGQVIEAGDIDDGGGAHYILQGARKRQHQYSQPQSEQLRPVLIAERLHTARPLRHVP